MATKKSTKKAKTAKTAKKSNNTLFSIYGARESNSGERVNISLVCGDEDSKQWATVSIKKKGGKIKVKLEDEFVTLKIPRLDVEDEEDEDEEDEDDEDEEVDDEDEDIPF